MDGHQDEDGPQTEAELQAEINFHTQIDEDFWEFGTETGEQVLEKVEPEPVKLQPQPIGEIYLPPPITPPRDIRTSTPSPEMVKSPRSFSPKRVGELLLDSVNSLKERIQRKSHEGKESTNMTLGGARHRENTKPEEEYEEKPSNWFKSFTLSQGYQMVDPYPLQTI